MRARQPVAWAFFAVCTAASAAAEPRRSSSHLPEPAFPVAALRVAAPFGTITSTFRTVAHNRAVGGVPDSYHLLGRAIDIVRRHGISHEQIAAAFRAAGFHLIESLDEGNHSHFAFAAARGAEVLVRTPPKAAPPDMLAADRHGLLMIDVGASPVRPASTNGSPSRAVH